MLEKADSLRTAIRGHEALVRIFPDKEALSLAAAEYLIGAVETTLQEQDAFSLALTGGSSPNRLYELLAGPCRDRIPWDQLHLFWGDDRYVPRDDPASNQGAAFRQFIDHVPIPAEQVYPMPVDISPAEAAAAAYQETLLDFFDGAPPTFDLVLLGLGGDGHIASLFPENHPERSLTSVDEATWVQAILAPARVSPRSRLTLSLPAINWSRRVLFIVHGAQKQEAVRKIVREPNGTLPGAYVHARRQLCWYVDKAAWGV